MASRNGQIKIVRELIERGADVNAKDNNKIRKDMEVQH